MNTRLALRLAMLVAIVGATIGLPSPCHADLMPASGLNPGDQFRFVFVTNRLTQATSSDIGFYDSFVNAQAGGARYNGSVIHWSAIATTSTINAIDHIGVSPIAGVFLVNGTKVTTSTDTTGLWSGALLSPTDVLTILHA